MEDKLRRSSRLVKPHRDPQFLYDTDSVRCFAGRGSSGESTNPSIDNSGKNLETPVFSDIADLPINADFLLQDNNSKSSNRWRSQSQHQRTASEEESNCVTITVPRTSSTRDDLLKNSFWSVSSALNTDTSDMVSEDEICNGNCVGCKQGGICSAAGKSTGKTVEAEDAQAKDSTAEEASKSAGDDAVAQLREAVFTLTSEVRALRGAVEKQDELINQIRESGCEESSSDRSQIRSDRGKSKEERAEVDKARSLKVVQEKIKVKDKISYDSLFSEEVPDEGVDMKGIKKKLTRKQRDLCRQQVDRRMKEAGATFPEDSFEATESSGTESDSNKRSCKHSCSSKIKSGAKVKKRPVKKTELWPHTIANEDDGDDIDCDNISLAKFFSCFSYIMLDCGILESRGRSGLLHAVSTVLEYLHWPDARKFHNVIILKIEQGVLDWESDFSALAENFVDKKVKMSIKSKGGATGTGSAYRPGKGYGKGFRGSSASYAGKGKGLHSAICWQWNFSSCTFGSNCKRWHVCKSCAEAGKLGEQHKASSHESSSSRPPTRDQRT